ncbi:helix-turn-helix domain-containing protein, partial [uncultured Microscilla sp.]|uniref:helix-turn-helix domain-containing protein n=1 Tax=uncultured Microscilla sp. TaxID=432653 RepID=UPI0026111B7A
MQEDITFTNETDIRTYRHQAIVRFSAQGLTQQSIAEGLGCSQGLVSQVLHIYEESGWSGLRAQTPPGASSRLSFSDLKQLEDYLRQGAKAFGYCTDDWNRPRVRELVAEKFGVHYKSLTSISRILD